jgi:hypothetical protein
LIRRFLQRALWWTARRVFGTRRVGDIDFVYISADKERTHAELEVVLKHALRLISLAKGGFGELVTSHLKLVGAVRLRDPAAWTSVRGYISPFRGHEGTNSQYLACQLVWAATFIRLCHDSFALGKEPELIGIREAAVEAQLRFVRQFENSDEWSAYLLAHRPQGRS